MDSCAFLGSYSKYNLMLIHYSKNIRKLLQKHVYKGISGLDSYSPAVDLRETWINIMRYFNHETPIKLETSLIS